MKHACLVLISLHLCISALSAQTNKVVFTKNNSEDLILLNNDTVLIKTDTAYLITKNNFRLYRGLRNKIITASNVSSKYFEGLQYFEHQVMERENAYDTLKKRFDSLATRSVVFIDNAKEKLSDIDSIQMAIKTDIKNSQAAIDSAKRDIVSSLTGEFYDRLYWGLGGAVIGIITGVLINSGR